MLGCVREVSSTCAECDSAHDLCSWRVAVVSGRRGMRLAYARTPWREAEVPSSIRVLYEDEHMMAVYKPSGLQVGLI